MSTEETVKVLEVKIKEALKELSGQDWIIKTKHAKWDVHFTCHLGEFARMTQDFDLLKPTEELIEDVSRIAEHIYLWYKRQQGGQ